MKAYYNGVALYRVLTKRWNETVVYDSTGVNMIGNQITIALEATILDDESVSTTPAIPPSSITTDYDSINVGINSNPQQQATAETKLNRALRLLSMARQPFVMYDDAHGAKIFEAYPDSATRLTAQQLACVDVNSGPKPRNVSVVSMVAGCYRINFEIEVTKIRCLGGETGEAIDKTTIANMTNGFVVSNRCWTREEVDENFYTTRTFSGVLRMSKNNISAHAFRNFMYPPLENGFKRERVTFSESQDGLSLEYSVVDKQVRNAAPYPVTKFEGSVQYSNTNGVVEDVTTQLTVTGSVFAPRKLLLTVACKTLETRIQKLAKAQSGYLVKATIAENLGDPPSFTLTTRHMIHCNIKSEGATEQYSNGTSDGTVFENDSEPSTSSLAKSKSTGAIGKTITSATKRGLLNGGDVTSATVKSQTQTGNAANSNQEKSGKVGEEYKITPQSMSFMADEIGKSFPTTVRSEIQTWVYNRKLSQNPSPYGYDVYCVYENEAKSASKKSEIEPNGFQFIKAMASVPCAPHLASVATNSYVSSSMNGAYATKVEQTSQTVLIDAKPTGETEADANYPYTYYKSHAIYTAELNRIVKPAFYGTTNDDEFSPPTILQVAPPTGKLFVTIEAERMNALPELPDLEEIVTFYRQSETEGGAAAEERPSESVTPSATTTMNTSNATIGNFSYGARSNKRIVAYGKRNSVQIADPKPGIYGQGTSYKVLANYEYILSRPIRKGDEIRLLLNPMITQASCYYPTNGEGTKEAWHNRRLFSGNQFNHYSETSTSAQN